MNVDVDRSELEAIDVSQAATMQNEAAPTARKERKRTTEADEPSDARDMQQSRSKNSIDDGDIGKRGCSVRVKGFGHFGQASRTARNSSS